MTDDKKTDTRDDDEEIPQEFFDILSEILLEKFLDDGSKTCQIK